MIIKEIYIQKFRGFNNVGFELWSHVTAISWQNGTQKTTILWMLSQPFSLRGLDMWKERPLCGWNFNSEFSEKFKFSEKYDRIGDHRWKLSFCKDWEYPMNSIGRDWNTKWEIRFWKVKENGIVDKTEWSWYKKYPTIYLSLKRLYPIWEDTDIKEVQTKLSQDEKEFYAEWHNKILILTKEDDKIIAPSMIRSPNKETIGANTNYYDRETNSAWHDNIGKILLAIMTFRRLKKKYRDYRAGLLVIDELDSSLYPGSQIELLKALYKFSKDYNIQIVFTTHSITLLEEIDYLANESANLGRIKSVFLEKEEKNITIEERSFEYIKHKLEVSIKREKKPIRLDVYCEDNEARIFIKKILGTKITKHLNFQDVNFGAGQYLDALLRKFKPFIRPNALIILDGDVLLDNSKKTIINSLKKYKNKYNIAILPGEKNPETLLAETLNAADVNFFKKINPTFSQQVAFREYSLSEIQRERTIAKKRFNSDDIAIYRHHIINERMKKNFEIVSKFREEFKILYNWIAKKRWLSTLL